MIVARFPTEEAARQRARRRSRREVGHLHVRAGRAAAVLRGLPRYAHARAGGRGLAGARTPRRRAVAEPLPSVTLPAALARVLTDYERAWAAKDAAGLAALFAEDGFVLAGGTPPVRGRAAIQRHYAGKGGPLSLRALAYATRARPGTSSAPTARRGASPTPASSPSRCAWTARAVADRVRHGQRQRAALISAGGATAAIQTGERRPRTGRQAWPRGRGACCGPPPHPRRGRTARKTRRPALIRPCQMSHRSEERQAVGQRRAPRGRAAVRDEGDGDERERDPEVFDRVRPRRSLRPRFTPG